MCSTSAVLGAVLITASATPARAQGGDGQRGFTVREVSLSSGYASVQLPPATVGGFVPNDILNEDFVTTGRTDVEWRRVTPFGRYTLGLSGTYTVRSRYSELNAPGGTVSFAMSRALGPRWRLVADVTSEIVNWDQFAFRPSQARQLVDGTPSFDDLAAALDLPRSSTPEATDTVPLVPISHSLDGADVYGNRILASSVSMDATYLHSVRLETTFRGNYARVRGISSSGRPGRGLSSPYSTEEGPGIGIKYRRSERSQITADADWSDLSGAYVEKALFATAGYGWTGRKWFAAARLGAAVRPFEEAVRAGLPTNRPWAHALVYSGSIGYRFRTQTLLVQFGQVPHDEYGHGGRNAATGFEGSVRSAAGTWSWSAPRGQWTLQADLWVVRRPGNYSDISSWLATAGVGRHFGPNVRLVADVVFDRHGSREFEGLDLTRRGGRLQLIWSPARRRVLPGNFD
jgi:hypothetical protein